MRYFTLAADYSHSGLSDDHAGPIFPEEAGLPHELSVRIREWNTRYRQVMAIGIEQRMAGAISSLIETLDEEGLAFAATISRENPDCKVRYFSEGHLRYLL